MVLLGNVSQGTLVSVHFEIVLVLAQDRCTVCAECTSGMKIILGTPIILLGNIGQEEACFGPFADSVNLGTT